MARVLLSNSTITGEVKMFAGSSAPEGYLLCQGQAVSRTTYASLFAILGTTYGTGDGSTTFNLPDYRGNFLRGEVNIDTITGSGTVSSNNATFTSHGVNRTGFKVRFTNLGGLTGATPILATDYYAIVVDSNTLAFATTKANAIAGTKITLTGSAVGAIIVQYEDPDRGSRVSKTQDDAMQRMAGSLLGDNLYWSIALNQSYVSKTGIISGVSTGGTKLMPSSLPGTAVPNGFYIDTAGGGIYRTSGDGLGSGETRPKNATINFIIKT
jgi:microcystin-dependent protein